MLNQDSSVQVVGEDPYNDAATQRTSITSPRNTENTFNTSELDYDTIDYSTAFRRENQRRLASEELLKLNGDFYKRSQSAVFNDFVNETMSHEGISNNDVVFDVLPSFEMYRSLQYTSNEAKGMPPDYFNLPNQGTSSGVTSPDYEAVSSTLDMGTINSNRDTSVSGMTFMTDSATPSTSSTSQNLSSSLFDGNHDLFDKNIVDNLNKFPRLESKDVRVEIHVTKDVPVPHKKGESESILKEYTSGDVVHGFVTITNTSNRDIPFQMFAVTLEGAISVIDTANKTQIVKRFLNTMDFSASWSFGCISPSANLKYKPGSLDYDGCELGLRNDRILKAKSSYKKFFTFKFPYNSLDTTCRHQQELHTLLPPSLGVNRIKGNGKYAHLEVTPALGYGHTGKKGTPILTRDFSTDSLSVNYSINATLIGFNPADPTSSKLMCLRDTEYCLRFIPFGFGVSLFSSQRSLTSLKKLIERTFETAERSLKLTLEGNEKEVEVLDRQLKLEQLSLGPNIRSSNNQTSYNFPLRNESYASSDFSKVETGLTYIPSGKPLNNLFSKFKSVNEQSTNGFITITTLLPKDGLPYISPSLIRKTNELSKLNNLGIANYNLMDSTLSSSEKKKLTALKINLKFSPSDYRDSTTQPIELPKIKSINARLLVLNVYSCSSIPIKLSSDIFLDKSDLFNKLQADFSSYDDQYQELFKKFELYGLDARKHIAPEISQDIKAMKNLKCDQYLLPVFNHSVEGLTNWVKSSESPEWTQSLHLNFGFKDSLQETLIPTFQTCLLSRIYCIHVEVSFKGGQTAQLRVPIRLRQFDGN